jgi:IS6 family transposase
VTPVEVVTDQPAAYPRILDEQLPAAWHRTHRYSNNRIEADHGQPNRRLRPMPGIKSDPGATLATAGHAFVQNLRQGHYELAVDEPIQPPVAVAFDELTATIRTGDRTSPTESACREP